MKTQVKSIATIQTGLFAKPVDMGEVVYLQSKHFDEYGQLLATLQPDLMAEGISEKHLLQGGDVLFSAKGTKNFAAVFENFNEPSVASTSFLVLRPTDKKVLSNYLAWFLNGSSTQMLLKGQAIGTSIPSISKQVLGNLEIPVPDIETQKTILHITRLRNKEKSLKREIDDLRDTYINNQLLKAINHER